MNIKYIKILTPVHWAKVLLPIFVLSAVLFSEGFISGQIGMFVEKPEAHSGENPKIHFSDEDISFAKALAEAELKPFKQEDYDIYLKYRFILKQRNYIISVKQLTNGYADDGEKAVKDERPAKLPSYMLTSVFIGKNKKFAVIDDSVIKSGQRLGSGETVRKIEEGRVLLSGSQGERWLYVSY